MVLQTNNTASFATGGVALPRTYLRGRSWCGPRTCPGLAGQQLAQLAR